MVGAEKIGVGREWGERGDRVWVRGVGRRR